MSNRSAARNAVSFEITTVTTFWNKVRPRIFKAMPRCSSSRQIRISALRENISLFSLWFYLIFALRKQSLFKVSLQFLTAKLQTYISGAGFVTESFSKESIKHKSYVCDINRLEVKHSPVRYDIHTAYRI
jgi:hypothetical protein